MLTNIMLFLWVWAFPNQPAAQGHQCLAVSAPGLPSSAAFSSCCPNDAEVSLQPLAWAAVPDQRPHSPACRNPLVAPHLFRAQLATRLLTLAQVLPLGSSLGSNTCPGPIKQAPLVQIRHVLSHLHVFARLFPLPQIPF